MNQTHTISVFADDTHGLLNKIVLLFSRRRIRIEQLTLNPSEREGGVVINVKITESERITENILKQLEKIIEVISVKAETSNNEFQNHFKEALTI